MADPLNESGGESQPRPARKRGGQPGNTNTLKHGYYSQSFKKGESADLEEMGQEADLTSEIAMMRVVIRRVFEAADDCVDLEGWVGVLKSLGAASTRLAGLLKTQKLLRTGGSEIADALSQALKEVSSELR